MKVTIEETSKNKSIDINDLYISDTKVVIVIEIESGVYGTLSLSGTERGCLYHFDRRTLEQLSKQLKADEFKPFHGKVILEQ